MHPIPHGISTLYLKYYKRLVISDQYALCVDKTCAVDYFIVMQDFIPFILHDYRLEIMYVRMSFLPPFS